MMSPLLEKEPLLGAGPPQQPEAAWTESSSSMFIIHLERDPLWRIVQKAMIHYLRAENPAIDLLKRFYAPAEQALIEAAVDFCKWNQTRSAAMLGINRNTLRKKLRFCGMSAQSLGSRENFCLKFPAGREIFLSQLSAIDLLEASRAKMFLLRQAGIFSQWQPSRSEPKSGMIQAFCAPVKQAIIKTALHAFENRLAQTAQCLGINRNTLKRQLKAAGNGPLSEGGAALL